MATRIPARLTASEGRKFAFTVGGAFLVLAAVMWWRGHQIPLQLFSAVGLTLIAAGIVLPSRLGPIYRGWMAFGLALSKVTTPIIMSIMFFLVMTPIGLLRRLFSRTRLIPARSAETFWHDRPAGDRRGDLKRQF